MLKVMRFPQRTGEQCPGVRFGSVVLGLTVSTPHSTSMAKAHGGGEWQERLLPLAWCAGHLIFHIEVVMFLLSSPSDHFR